MYLLSGRGMRIALLSLVGGIFAVSANAQKATFTLPFETHWNNAVLPAGDYTLSSVSTISWPKVLTVSGQGKTVYILASVEELAPESERSYLRIENNGDTHVVREYNSGIAAKSFLFEAPKSLRTELAARGHSQEITKVAVLTRH